MEKYDYLVVGCGFSGAVLAERLASQLNKKILIVDKRSHIGGNAYDYYNEDGILVHKYGPHIFHTNSKKVWDYLSKFTRWNVYFHKVLAYIDGKKVPVPFNINSLYEVFPQKLAARIEAKLLEYYKWNTKVPILDLMKTKDADLKFLAEFIYKNIFLNYNLKQWGVKPEELNPSVSARVPIYVGKDNRYFTDIYQGIPLHGYTKMFENILSHKNISILLKTDYKDIIEIIKYDKIIYTGPIDYFFDYLYGELPYRSLSFRFQTKNLEYFQETAQINYPNNYNFTRIIEFKYMTKQIIDKTTISYEYPCEFKKDINEPYYPIPNEENEEIFNKYKHEAKKLGKSVIFLGRLADYKYYNMDQIVARALNVFQNIINKKILDY